MTAPGRVRDRVKANRKVDEEPLWKVIDRALDALETDSDPVETPSVDLAEMLEDLDGPADYDDLVAACRQALREELPEEVLHG